MRYCALIAVFSAGCAMAQMQTRGVGVYPGDPREDFSPVSRIDNSTYRNLALYRAAWHSSSYDYNLTAQLVTDGIRERRLPRWLAAGSSEKAVLEKNEREWLLDGNWVTTVDVKGPRGWVQAGFLGGEGPVQVDRGCQSFRRRGHMARSGTSGEQGSSKAGVCREHPRGARR